MVSGNVWYSCFHQLGSCSVCLRQWPHCSSLIFCHSFRERASAACLLCSARCSWISSGCSWSNIPCPGLVFLEDKYLGKHNTPIKIMDAVNAWTLGLFFPGSLVTSRWDQCLVPPIPQWALFLDDMGTWVLGGVVWWLWDGTWLGYTSITCKIKLRSDCASLEVCFQGKPSTSIQKQN